MLNRRYYSPTMGTTLSAILQPYSQANIARALNVPKPTVARWYHGEGVPPVKLVPALAELLRVSVEDLTQIIARSAELGIGARRAS